MVQQQILGRGIDNPRLLEAFLATPRHLFVEEALSERAYGDSSLPIGWGQTISQPYVVARMIDLLEIHPGDRVLEIGTGSGYQAAILWRVGAALRSVERLEPLARRARENWARVGAGPIPLRVADGSLGWPAEAPFAAILVSAAAPAAPPSLLAQLVPGGRMVIPIGDALQQTIKRLRRTAGGAAVEDHGSCSFVRLVGDQGFSA